MPRLPTIRVTGSQFISTSLPGAEVAVAMASPPINSPLRLVAGRELAAGSTPLRFLVERVDGPSAQRADHRAVEAARRRRDAAAGRLVHERHELVGEARHRAADADAADVGAAADAAHPAALGHVAFHHRTPAAELDDAFRRAVFLREVALLVIAGAVAAL